MRDATRFGANTTTDEVLEGLDLGGKLVLVTGGSSGLGQETARALVKGCALDPTNAERLWALSERLVGERFALG